MTKPLLERQVNLLHYLTSRAAIFGDDSPTQLHPCLEGIDPYRLRLEARFSHQKRIEKIAAVFPMTFELLGNRREALLTKFAESYPPTDINRLTNACQFFDFLSTPPGFRPAFLRDVAACELACARVRVAAQPLARANRKPGSKLIRRNPAVALQRCAHDVRPVFEQESTRIRPPRRDIRLAIALGAGDNDLAIFEVAPAMFDLLQALDHWTDASAFGETLERRTVLAELRKHGLIEVRG